MPPLAGLLSSLGRRPPSWLVPVEALAEAAAMAAFAAMMLSTLLQVFARYLHIPLDWTEELARVLFLGSMMIGIALAIRRREHIVVDYFFARASARIQAILSIAFDAAILVLLLLWLRGAVRLLELNSGATFVTLPWLGVSYLYAAEALGIAMMILFVLTDLVRRGRSLKADRKRP